MRTFGYCRVSRKTQNIERQIRNIKAVYPDALIVQEAATGTKLDGRKELDKLLKILREGDTLVFDSASRMSRNEDEAIQLYSELYSNGVELVFLKEPHINSEVYKKALKNQIKVDPKTGNKATDRFVTGVIDALNRYTIDLAKEQISLVFAQAQKEVDDLHQRTAEGILTAKLNGKRIGQPKGAKLTTKKSIATKEIIKKRSKDFDGMLNDDEVIAIAKISRNSFYKYKRELRESLAISDCRHENCPQRKCSAAASKV